MDDKLSFFLNVNLTNIKGITTIKNVLYMDEYFFYNIDQFSHIKIRPFYIKNYFLYIKNSIFKIYNKHNDFIVCEIHTSKYINNDIFCYINNKKNILENTCNYRYGILSYEENILCCENFDILYYYTIIYPKISISKQEYKTLQLIKRNDNISSLNNEYEFLNITLKYDNNLTNYKNMCNNCKDYIIQNIIFNLKIIKEDIMLLFRTKNYNYSYNNLDFYGNLLYVKFIFLEEENIFLGIIFLLWIMKIKNQLSGKYVLIYIIFGIPVN